MTTPSSPLTQPTAMAAKQASGRSAVGALVADAGSPDTAALGDRLASVLARLSRWATHSADLPGPYAQVRLLGLIGSEQPVRLTRLAELDRCSQPTMSTLVSRAEEAGWVRRTPDPRDRRAADLELTEAGNEALAQTRAARGVALAPLLADLEPADISRVWDAVEILEVVAAGMGPP